MLEAYSDSYIVAEAITASEAISLLSSFQPSVILIDTQLPQRSAFILCNRLMAIKPEVPIYYVERF